MPEPWMQPGPHLPWTNGLLSNSFYGIPLVESEHLPKGFAIISAGDNGMCRPILLMGCGTVSQRVQAMMDYNATLRSKFGGKMPPGCGFAISEMMAVA